MRVLAHKHLDTYNAKDTRREGIDLSCANSALWTKVTKPRTAGQLDTDISEKSAGPGGMWNALIL